MGVFWTLGHITQGSVCLWLSTKEGFSDHGCFVHHLCPYLVHLSGGELDLYLLRKLSIRLLQKAQRRYFLEVKLNIVDTEKEQQAHCAVCLV